MNQGTFSKPLKVAFSVLALSWVLFGYYRYLSSPSWEALKDALGQTETFLVRAGIFDVLLILGLWAASDFLGAWLLRILDVRPHVGVERLVMSIAAGLSLLSLSTTVLTIANLLYRSAGWTLVGVPAFFWLLSRKEFDCLTMVSALRRMYGGKRTGKAASKQNEQATPVFPDLAERRILLGHRLTHGFLLSYISIALGLTLISALAPPLEFDDLAYQLSGPKAYVEKHRLQPLPHNPMTFMPRNVQMLYALGMLMHNEVTAKLIHYGMGLLTMLAAYALGLRLHSRIVGLVAAAILASSPLFLWEMRTAHIDVGLALYVFLILYALTIWWNNRDQAWHCLLLWFMGFSLGVKYHALFALGAVTLLVLILHAARTKNARQAIAATLKFFFLSLIGLFIPWGAANLYFTGNPVFPMFHEVFKSRYWTSELTKLIIHQQKDVGIPLTLANWREWLTIPWQLFISEPRIFKGNLGPFCLLFTPLLLFQRRMGQEIRLILCFSSVYGLFWLFTSQHARYLLPVLPGLAVLSGIGLVGWLGSWQGTIARNLACTMATGLAMIAILNLPFFPNYSNAYYGTSIMETLPLQ
ncbi:MAG: ArnT family glycosyltransferase, partial [Terriglobia bacterium]